MKDIEVVGVGEIRVRRTEDFLTRTFEISVDLSKKADKTYVDAELAKKSGKMNIFPGDHIVVHRKSTDNEIDFTIDSVQFPVKIGGHSADVLYGDGTPNNPLGVSVFTGATARDDGKPGAVPAPTKDERNFYLKGDGTWSLLDIPEQVQSDWNETSTVSPAYILNKPDIGAMVLAATTEVTAGDNTRVVHTEDPSDHHNIYTIHADAKPQVQADWNQTDEEAVDYIRNKPVIDADVTSSDGTNVQVEVTQTDGKITGVSIVTDNTVGRGEGTFTEGNIPTFDEDGNIIDSGLSVESSIQGVSIDGTALTPDEHNVVDIPLATSGADGAMSAEDKAKLDSVATGAEANVQSDWAESDSNSDAFIKNKPENLVQDANYVHTDNNYTTAEKEKLAGIEAGAEVNVIETVKVDRIPLTVTEKTVNIDLSGKADKAVPSASGNLAGLDATGNLTDSGIAATSVVTDGDLDDVIASLDADVTSDDGTNVQVTVKQENGKITEVGVSTDNTESIENKLTSWQQTPDDTHYPSEKLVKDELDTKAGKVENPVVGNLAGLASDGNLTDSGYSVVDTAGEGFEDNVPTGGAVLEAIADHLHHDTTIVGTGSIGDPIGVNPQEVVTSDSLANFVEQETDSSDTINLVTSVTASNGKIKVKNKSDVGLYFIGSAHRMGFGTYWEG